MSDSVVDEILAYNNKLAAEASKGYITDLQALAMLSDFAAGFTPRCSTCFVRNMGAVLTGHDDHHPMTDELLYEAGRRSLNPANDLAAKFGQTGYSSVFQDPQTGAGQGGNQAHHFWFYTQAGYENGGPVAILPRAAVVLHETVIYKFWGTQNWLAPNGRSAQDVALGEVGVDLGVVLAQGNVTPMESGNWIQVNLAAGSQASDNWFSWIRPWLNIQ
jgi:hypothetical protein